LQLALKNLGIEINRIKRSTVAKEATASAKRATGEFNKELEKILKDGEKNGELDNRKVAELQDESDAAVDSWLNALNSNPSKENMVGLLETLSTRGLIGLDPVKEVEAFRLLMQAADTQNRTAERNFRNHPTAENFRTLLNRSSDSQQLGGEGLRLLEMVPLRRVRPGKTHCVRPGETLAGIANYYYGKVHLWSVIYLKNSVIVGNNPNKLSPGIVLTIP
jgi:nucleoid-associated protein YgaU